MWLAGSVQLSLMEHPVHVTQLAVTLQLGSTAYLPFVTQLAALLQARLTILTFLMMRLFLVSLVAAATGPAFDLVLVQSFEF